MDGHIITIKSGQIKGYERDGIIEYLGIPYAEPPVGERRFQRAVPIRPWKGILDAKAYGPESVQLDEGVCKGSEDCLTINVQRPLSGQGLPVFVYIHGGGYNTGSASVPLYHGRPFAEKGIVYVSFQYRLNVLGFYDFTTYEGCGAFDSNCGLSDQILAVTWVHQNIAAFGGDPGRVTICGESAGGASVINMLAAPAVKGMFHQAVVQSGLPNCVMTHEMARENISLFLEGMGWSEKDLPKMKTAEDPFIFQKGNTYVAQWHQYKNPGMFLPGPVIDDLLPVRPIDAIRNGSAEGVKLIIGTNRHEGTAFVHPENTGFPNSYAMIAQMFEKNKHTAGLAGIASYYGMDADGYPKDSAAEDLVQQPAALCADDHAFVEFATDYAFLMPAIKVADAQMQYADVWMYRYELVTKSGQETGLKASHAFDLPAVFADKEFHFSRFIFDGEPAEVADNIIRDMHTPWVNFIKTGSPDHAGWPKYEGHNTKIRIFDRKTVTKQIEFTELMKAWKDMRFYEG